MERQKWSVKSGASKVGRQKWGVKNGTKRTEGALFFPYVIELLVKHRSEIGHMTLGQKRIPHSIQRSYIVCSTGRSGSSLLCKTLASLGNCGNPAEFFHPNALPVDLTPDNRDSFYAYYLAVLDQGTTPNGIFGVKIHWHHFKQLLVLARHYMDHLRDKSDREITECLFPNPAFIFISRQDILRQAISTCIAFQTDVWGLNRADREREKVSQAKQKKLRFAPLSIYRYKVGLQMANRAWERFFVKNDVPFHALVYEDLVASYEPTIRGIYAFLDLEFDPRTLAVPTKRQANAINERWARYYAMIPEELLGYYSNLRVSTRKWIEHYR